MLHFKQNLNEHLRGILMDTGELYAKISQMRSAAATLGRSAATITDSIESIDREVQALSSDRFMSIGAETFRVEYNRATPKLRDAFDQLIAFQDKLNTSADDIEAASRSGSNIL